MRKKITSLVLDCLTRELNNLIMIRGENNGNNNNN
jgi:hypothetical protein